MKIINKTKHPTSTVRRLIRTAMGSWGANDEKITVEVYPDSAENRHYGSSQRVGDGVLIRLYVYDKSAAYPLQQRQVGHEAITFKDWQEALVATAAHEAWHLRNGRGEQKAEAAGRRKLTTYRRQK